MKVNEGQQHLDSGGRRRQELRDLGPEAKRRTREDRVKGKGKDVAEAWGGVEGGQEQSCWGEDAQGAWGSLRGPPELRPCV